MNRIWNRGLIFAAAASVCISCGGQAKHSGTGTTLAGSDSEKYPGLVVNGPRPRDNVVYNMDNIVAVMEANCEREQHGNFSGTLALSMRANHAGEVSVDSFTCTSPDSVYAKRLAEGIYMLDFDPWNDNQDETSLFCPLRFSNGKVTHK